MENIYEETRKKMIRERIEKIEKINAYENDLYEIIKNLEKKYKRLTEEKKEIMTELDIIAK